MMVVGRTVLAIFSEFSEFIDDSFASVSTLLLVSGVVMLGVAAFGVFAAVKESTLLTNIVSDCGVVGIWNNSHLCIVR